MLGAMYRVVRQSSSSEVFLCPLRTGKEQVRRGVSVAPLPAGGNPAPVEQLAGELRAKGLPEELAGRLVHLLRYRGDSDRVTGDGDEAPHDGRKDESDRTDVTQHGLPADRRRNRSRGNEEDALLLFNHRRGNHGHWLILPIALSVPDPPADAVMLAYYRPGTDSDSPPTLVRLLVDSASRSYVFDLRDGTVVSHYRKNNAPAEPSTDDRKELEAAVARVGYRVVFDAAAGWPGVFDPSPARVGTRTYA